MTATTPSPSLVPRPGLIGLTHGTGAVSKGIRIGQHFRFDSKFSHWNHAFVLDTESTLIEMGGHGARRRDLVEYSDTEHVLIDPMMELDLDYAEWALAHHAEYGYLTIVSLTFSLSTGAKLEFGTKGTLICSGLVAACMNVPEWRADPSHVMPAELDMKFAACPRAGFTPLTKSAA